MGKKRRINVNNQVDKKDEENMNQKPVNEANEDELDNEPEEKEFFLKRVGRAVWRQRWKVAAGAALIGGTVAGVLIGRNSNSKSDDEETSYGNEPLRLGTDGYDDSTENYDNEGSDTSYEESEVS